MAINDEPSPSKRLFAFLTIILLLPLTVAAFTPRGEAEETGRSQKTYQQSWDDEYIRLPLDYEPIEAEKTLYNVTWYGNGTCVPYTRYRSGIDMYGNAATFLDRAYDEGYRISQKPILGSIVVIKPENGLWHTAVVEEILESQIHISEQNYKGLYILSERMIDINNENIKGYIY